MKPVKMYVEGTWKDIFSITFGLLSIWTSGLLSGMEEISNNVSAVTIISIVLLAVGVVLIFRIFKQEIKTPNE